MPKPPPIVHDLDTQDPPTSQESAAAVLDLVIRNLYRPPSDAWAILAAILDAHDGDPAEAAAELASRHAKRNRAIRLVPANRQLTSAELARILTRAVEHAIADRWANAFEPGAAGTLARALTELPKPAWAGIYAHLREISRATAQSWTDERAAPPCAGPSTTSPMLSCRPPPSPKTSGAAAWLPRLYTALSRCVPHRPACPRSRPQYGVPPCGRCDFNGLATTVDGRSTRCYWLTSGM